MKKVLLFILILLSGCVIAQTTPDLLQVVEVDNTLKLPVANGGTNVGTFTTNGVLYGNAATSVLVSPASTVAGQFLQTTTIGSAPTWRTTLGVANGGTGTSTAFTTGSGTGASTHIWQSGTTLTTGTTLQTMGTKMTLLGSGRLGLGTTTPQVKFAVIDATGGSGEVAKLGWADNAASETLLGFTYRADNNTVSPVAIGYKIDAAGWTGTTFGALVFKTRSVTTANTVPTERMIIMGGGNVGIGVALPSAALHLKAGTATSSTAPLKLNTGTLNTTAEAGAMEFLTDALHFTITTGAARKTIAFLESPAFTGTPTLPTGSIGTTQTAGNSTTALATTAFVTTALAGVVNIFEASLSLTSAQILALFTTPIQIVAAPGAGKYIEWMSCSSTITFVTTAYATNLNIILISEGSAAGSYVGTEQLSLPATATRTVKIKHDNAVSSTSALQIITNAALQVSVLTGNPTAGDGSIKLRIIYRIVTI